MNSVQILSNFNQLCNCAQLLAYGLICQAYYNLQHLIKVQTGLLNRIFWHSVLYMVGTQNICWVQLFCAVQVFTILIYWIHMSFFYCAQGLLDYQMLWANPFRIFFGRLNFHLQCKPTPLTLNLFFKSLEKKVSLILLLLNGVVLTTAAYNSKVCQVIALCMTFFIQNKVVGHLKGKLFQFDNFLE
eukprot:TRINITY_DN17479_c0_g1_i2.p2 TRINITY_DN17479_c0_g1~~TRINITY_DN17479_c0_g1_i2.p2  ORF type:complete len:186 (+),score=-3.95 TRINITY_DN17479_c0_g1_i2:218-775(+)